jgi:hypothetical protein
MHHNRDYATGIVREWYHHNSVLAVTVHIIL